MNFKPNIGDVFLNKYEIVSLVGEGAFGSVYRARDTKLDRIVAIKFINATNTTLDRFTDELDAIKGLDHPNIVRLYDYDILKGGFPCMVMEFIKGRELGDILAEKGHFELIQIAEIAQQVLDALVETHKHNIIHCDLKPENIMLTSVGARNDVVKLIDFGIASLKHKDEEIDDERSKLLVGTAQYMAPEQITHGELGPWTDIYAFGLIMIELFTGEFVFDDDDIREVLRMQLHSPVVLPHALAVSELGPIISRATQKEISKRYTTTKEFYDDVCEALQSMRESQQKVKKKIEVGPRNRAMSAILDDLEDFGVLSSETPAAAAPNAPVAAPVFAKAPDPEPVNPNQARAEAEKRERVDTDKLAQAISLTTMSLKDEVKKDKEKRSAEQKSLIQPPSDPMPLLTPAPAAEEKKKSHLSKDLKPASEPKKSSSGAVIAIVIAVIVFLGIGGYAYMKNSGLLGSNENADLAKTTTQSAPTVQNPNVVLFSTQKKTAGIMATAAAASGAYGVSKDISKYTTYRIVGTPTTASVFIDKAIACHKTPCSINIFGDPNKINLQLRKDQKSKDFNLADRNPEEKIIVVLK